jgi:hypothetical protein
MPVKPGQSRPISKDRTVPETAPTAKSTAITCDQRCASFSATGSFLLSPMKLAINTRTEKGDAQQHQDNVGAEGECHQHPRGKQFGRIMVRLGRVRWGEPRFDRVW